MRGGSFFATHLPVSADRNIAPTILDHHPPSTAATWTKAYAMQCDRRTLVRLLYSTSFATRPSPTLAAPKHAAESGRFKRRATLTWHPSTHSARCCLFRVCDKRWRHFCASGGWRRVYIRNIMLLILSLQHQDIYASAAALGNVSHLVQRYSVLLDMRARPKDSVCLVRRHFDMACLGFHNVTTSLPMFRPAKLPSKVIHLRRC